jgi:pilus assembly protein Flp/PilA
MLAAIKRFVKDEQGLETVEYAVMTALIVAALIAAIVALSGAVSGRFGEVTGVINAEG